MRKAAYADAEDESRVLYLPISAIQYLPCLKSTFIPPILCCLTTLSLSLLPPTTLFPDADKYADRPEEPAGSVALDGTGDSAEDVKGSGRDTAVETEDVVEVNAEPLLHLRRHPDEISVGSASKREDAAQ